jgi:hypothetical protein
LRGIETDDLLRAVKANLNHVLTGDDDVAHVAVDDADFVVIRAEDEAVADGKAARSTVGEIAALGSAIVTPAKQIQSQQVRALPCGR